MIRLNYNFGYKWYKINSISVKGYLFDEKNRLYENKKLIKYFETIKTIEEFENKLKNTNGIFSVIIKNKDNIFIAVDRTRTFPMFYSLFQKNIYISDNLDDLNNLDFSRDDFSIQEFLSAGFVTSKNTLMKNIFQLEAGECLSYNYKKNKITSFYYTDYLTKEIFDEDYEKLKGLFLKVLDRVIKRVIDYANGDQIVVPLSGGYDSRLIISLFKKYNYTNVICFTYGNKKSFEVKISQKIAEKLGYEWYFFEYNEELISKDYINSELFKKYAKFASNYVSIPHLQDFFAFNSLKKIIEPNAIIVPGHSGDFLAGSHFVKNPKNEIELIDLIFNKHFIYDNKSIDINKIKQKIRNSLDLTGVKKDFYYSVLDNWNLKERQAKFIVNANRVYEFFGYRHIIPLWDNELISFFRKLPLKYKKNSIFYNQILLDEVFEPLNIEYKKPKKYNLIKKLIPFKLKQVLKKLFKKDINNFHLIGTPLKYSLKEKYIEDSMINYLLTKWCLVYLYKYKRINIK